MSSVKLKVEIYCFFFTEHEFRKKFSDELLRPFQTYLHESGKGIRTISEYVAAVLSLEKWILGYFDGFQPDHITARDLHEWISFMQTVEKLASAMINKRVAAIKIYWAFLTQSGHFTINLTLKENETDISLGSVSKMAKS